MVRGGQEAALRVDDALRSDPPETIDETWGFVLDSWIAGGEWPFEPSAQIYRELQNSGDLDLIASGSMQRRLRDYYEDSVNEIETLTIFQSGYRDLSRQLIEGRVGMVIGDCLSSAASPEPSQSKVQIRIHSTKTVRRQKIFLSFRTQPKISGSPRRSECS